MARLTLLVLVLCSAGAASLRLDAIGPHLAGIIDDNIWDASCYVQRNQSRPDWLAGVELLPFDGYCLFGFSPGPVSVGAVLPATLGSFTEADLILPVSFRAAGLGWGTCPYLPRFRSPGPDTSLSPGAVHGDFTFRWSAVTGGCWSRPGLGLDVNLDIAFEEFTCWTDPDSEVILLTRDRCAGQLLSLRLTRGSPDGRLPLRSILAYEHWFNEHTDFDVSPEPPSWFEPDHTLGLASGISWQPSRNLLVAAGVRGRARAYADWIGEGPADWTLDARAPVGVEFTTGILTLRLGADLSWSDVEWADQPFERKVYAGFALRVHRNVLLEFLPGLDDAANLHAWELAASVRI